MDTKEMAKIFKALSNPNRLELYLKIANNYKMTYKTYSGCLIHEIVQSLKISLPTVSRHLKELSNANLISTERTGKYLVAIINKDIVDEVNKIFNINDNVNNIFNVREEINNDNTSSLFSKNYKTDKNSVNRYNRKNKVNSKNKVYRKKKFIDL